MRPSSHSLVLVLASPCLHDATSSPVVCAAALWRICEGAGAGAEPLCLQVSEAGSVVVEKLMEVERYSHVMHISSTVTGRLLPELDAWDALRAALPAGTVSGAPKVRHRYSISVEWCAFVVLGMQQVGITEPSWCTSIIRFHLSAYTQSQRHPIVVRAYLHATHGLQLGACRLNVHAGAGKALLVRVVSATQAADLWSSCRAPWPVRCLGSGLRRLAQPR